MVQMNIPTAWDESGKSSINKYFQNLDEALTEMFRVLKPGGSTIYMATKK